MQPIENRITNKLTRGVPGNRGVLSFFPKGALTHHPRAGGGIPPVGRAVRSPRGNCAFCGKRQTMPPCPWMLAVIVCAAQGYDAPPYAAMENLPLAAFQHDGYRHWRYLFFLRTRNKNRKREDGENEWRFIIWKRRSLAAALVDPLLPLLPI